MSVLIAIALFLGWSCIGGALLKLLRIFPATDGMLLAPTLGMAVATVVTCAASFVGFTIAWVVWPLAFALVLSAILLLRAWRGWNQAAAIYGAIVVVNLATVGIGLFIYGAAWQGMVNGDAAVASLAAQYFTAHPFFFHPTVDGIFSGVDYSSLSSILYVSGGQRFGDAMLLGLSARAFHLHPDEVYMAHSLAVRCAMVATTAMLVPRTTGPRVMLILILLSLSPLSSYAYLNELTSQVGGMALLFASIVVIDRFMQSSSAMQGPDSIQSSRGTQSSHSILRFALLLAVVGAALSEAYPESLPYLLFSSAILTAYRGVSSKLPSAAQMAKLAAVTIVFVLLFVNVGLPNVLAATANVLSWGGVLKGGPVHDIRAIFPYAFLPDAFAFLVGFEAIGQGLSDPFASLLIVAGCIACAAVLLFIVLRARRYLLLSSLTSATALIFVFFYFKHESFGAFKTMILAQPLIFVAFAQMLQEAWDSRRFWVLGLGSLAVAGNVFADQTYIRRSLQANGTLPQLAKSNLLDRIDELVRRSSSGVILEAQDGLLSRFAMLRQKPEPLRMGMGIRSVPGMVRFRAHVAANPFFRFLPPDADFADELMAGHAREYPAVNFACSAGGQDVSFAVLAAEGGASQPRILPGATLAPLNKLVSSERDLIYVKDGDRRPFLIFRASSVGGYGTSDSVRTLYGQENDFALPQAYYAGVGRYLLLETLLPNEDPIQLRISVTRTPFGGATARLQPIRILGKESIEISATGSGALDLVSAPIQPCVVQGRKFVLVDFGEAQKMGKVSPYLYRFLNVEYSPDPRETTGFLRDISVANASAAPAGAAMAFDWDFGRFDANFEFSGLYEDGWISDHIRLRPRRACCAKLVLDFDVPGEEVAQGPVSVTVTHGKTDTAKPLVAGRNTISVDLAANDEDYVDISIDKPMTLPGGDNRRILGLLRHISLQ